MRPISVDPVNEIWRTSGDSRRTSPIGAGSPQTRFSTPAGNPASWKTSKIFIADKGVSSAGFATMVFPAATAGAILRSNIAFGKFHGVIHATTPRARLRR